jgi:hypothetical protein
MQLEQQFTILIYPFVHALVGAERSTRLSRLDGRWLPWWQVLADAERARFLDDTYFFLPYIRTLLFPETAHLPAGDPSTHPTHLDRLTSVPASQLAAKLNPDGVVRLRYAGEHRDALQPLRLVWELRDAQGAIIEQLDPPAPLCIDWIDVLFFPQGVGFLLLKLHLDESTIPVKRLNEILYHLRLVLPPRVGWQMADWQRTRPDAPLTFSSRDLVDYLLQGLTSASDRLTYETIDALRTAHLNAPSRVPRYTSTEPGQVYGQSLRLYSYACLDNTSAAGDTAQTDPPFEHPAQRALYELATCTATDDPDYIPHQRGLAQLIDQSYIALWDNWQGMALHDNVVFLVNRPTGFTQGALAHNVESDYLHLYLLTLYQKVRLNWLSGELLRHSADLHHNLSEARALWDAHMMFRNHYWFTEVTFRPQGITLYKQFQQGLGSLALYAALSSEVQDLQAYYEQKVERQTNTLLNFITIIGLLLGVPGVLTQVYGSDLLTLAAWPGFLLSLAIGYIIVGSAWLLIQRWAQR